MKGKGEDYYRVNIFRVSGDPCNYPSLSLSLSTKPCPLTPFFRLQTANIHSSSRSVETNNTRAKMWWPCCHLHQKSWKESTVWGGCWKATVVEGWYYLNNWHLNWDERRRDTSLADWVCSPWGHLTGLCSQKHTQNFTKLSPYPQKKHAECPPKQAYIWWRPPANPSLLKNQFSGIFTNIQNVTPKTLASESSVAPVRRSFDLSDFLPASAPSEKRL